MPFALFKSVYSVSSEDNIHCASNLLKNNISKKWKTASTGEKSAYVILQFERPEIITGIDIGNEHSAFIEVLVGKNGWRSDDFKELILTSSFMTPIESKNSNNTNRIRCFSQTDESWIKHGADYKWDLVKILCTQPFNKHVQYGISLLKVHAAAQNETIPLVPRTFINRQTEIVQETKNNDENFNSSKFIGLFRLRDDSDEDETGTLFNRWKNHLSDVDVLEKSNTAAAVHDASKCNELKYPSAVKLNKTPKQEHDLENKCIILDRNRIDLLYDEIDEKPNKKMEKKIELDKERLLKKTSVDTKKKGSRCEINQFERKNVSKQNNQDLQNFENITSSSKLKNIYQDNLSEDEQYDDRNVNSNIRTPKRPSNSSVDERNSKRKKKNVYKSFNQLLEDVVFSISGIQNPIRADIRSKGISLGAKYKPDWDSSCTHLVCAFKNTPKYNQVKRMNGKIIKKIWIENCFNLKKRLPWRRYALDSDEENMAESEDEILDISTKQFENNSSCTLEKIITSKIKYASSKNEISDKDGETLNKEIIEDEMLRENEENVQSFPTHIQRKCNKDKDTSTFDVFEVSTDEDEFTKDKKIKIKTNESKFFSKFLFYLDSDLCAIDKEKLLHIIEQFGGSISQKNAQCDYIISNRLNFIKDINFKGKIVKPLWIFECNDMECLIPINRYLI